MKLYTVGPVQMYERTLDVAKNQVPYFRNRSFSEIVLECEHLLKRFAGADDDSRMVLLTASGTGAMEAVVMNCLGEGDKALVVDGGSFGHRFAQICDIHGISHDDIALDADEQLEPFHLERYRNRGYSALLVNLDETSTGQLYDLEMLSRFAREQDMFFIVDAISAFLSDEINMSEAGIDSLIVSSQKALAIGPGLSFVLLSAKALGRLDSINSKTLYFDFKDYLANGLRGQTPFTPAVGLVYELHDRLIAIDQAGGVRSEVEKASALASDFRERVSGLPLRIATFKKSNAVTRIVFDQPIAAKVCQYLEEEYGFVLNPCGGEMANSALRVAHIGNLTLKDNENLVIALRDAVMRFGGETNAGC